MLLHLLFAINNCNHYYYILSWFITICLQGCFISVLGCRDCPCNSVLKIRYTASCSLDFNLYCLTQATSHCGCILWHTVRSLMPSSFCGHNSTKGGEFVTRGGGCSIGPIIGRARENNSDSQSESFERAVNPCHKKFKNAHHRSTRISMYLKSLQLYRGPVRASQLRL